MILKLRITLATGTENLTFCSFYLYFEIQKYYSIYSVSCMKGDHSH